MRVLVQWTRANPTDWEPLELTDLRQIRQLPRKGEPAGGEVIDDSPGWLFAFNVQGIIFSGFDHYSARPGGGASIDILCWNDDPVDYPNGPWGQVWNLQPPGPDPRYGGQVNTRQLLTIYTDDPEQIAFWSGQTTSAGPVVVRPWAEFPKPVANLIVHGIWTSDELAGAHRAARAQHGWREWSE